MFARVAPFVGLAGIAVSLHGCGGGGTTAAPTTAAPTKSTTTVPDIANAGTCGRKDFPDVADCDRVDFGSCGNACCELTTIVPMSPEDVVRALNESLASGGQDGQYQLQSLFKGDLGFTSLGAAGFLGQVYHTTAGPGHYNDTVNFHVEASGLLVSKVTGFSLSLVGGALGDSGQSFKNIIMALKGADLGNWDRSVTNVGGSCPASPGKTAARAQREKAEVVEHRRLDDIVGTCGLNQNVTVPECQNVDRGSCGNACCSLTATVSLSAYDAVKKLNDSFVDGGPDGQFTKQPTAEGTLGFANLTGMAPPTFASGQVYIGQVHHMTTGGAYHFNDTLNFNIVEAEDGGATITAFSSSLIGGAYSDAGQNYKNLVMALSAFNETGVSVNTVPGNFALSCPAPSSSVLV